ncbi:MAG: ABC transporter permease [Gemmatimonadota bacterium]|nr:MAG: ABC transporter permease [Gemmatimonadota bacterium]
MTQAGRSAYRTVLRLLPPRFRGEYGSEMEQLFAEALDAARRRGRLFFLFGWTRGIADVIALAWRIRWGRSVAGRRNQLKHKASSMSGFIHDLGWSARSIARSPLFTVAVVATLAIGIGATVSMFSVLDAAMIRALPYPDSDRLVYGRTTFGERVNAWVSYPDYADFRDGSDAFESLAAILGGVGQFTVTGDQGPERVSGRFVGVDFFPTLGVAPILGRNFTADEAEPGTPDVVMLSYGYWQRRFGGDTDVLGQVHTVAGSPHTVVGVMPPRFRYRYGVDVWLPIRLGSLDTRVRRSHSWNVVGRLRPEATVAEAQSQVDVIAAQLAEAYPDSHEDKGFLITPLGEALVEGYRPNLIILMAATGLLLLIACGNVASLMLARATARKVELSAKAALGASRKRLATQFMTESLLLATVAGLLGTMLALWLQQLILVWMPIDFVPASEVGVSASMLTFALVASFGTAIVFGTAPALTASQASPADVLRGGQRSSAHGGAARMRSGLVVLQVALTVVLLTVAGLLLQSFLRLRAVDLGYETENLLTAQIEVSETGYPDRNSTVQFYRGFLDEVRAIPGVRGAGLISHTPIRDRYSDWTVWNPENPPTRDSERQWALARRVLPGYFSAMGIPVLRGRDHSDSDVDSIPSLLVINQRVAEWLFPGEKAVGRQIALDIGQSEPGFAEVIGVVSDVNVSWIGGTPAPQMYFNNANAPTYWSRQLNLVVRTAGNPTALVRPIRDALRELDPNVPLADIAAMDDIVQDALSGSRVIALTITLFGSVALFLAMTGLYGVLAYYVTRRTREIGIRVAFGASSGHVMRMVTLRGLALVVGGLLVGVLGAVAATRLLQLQLYEIGSGDPITFVLVAAFLLLVGMLACYLPVRRALSVDPVEALRSE